MKEGKTLEHKVAIITGGSMGIGKAIAEAFVREGASLVLAARNPVPLQATRDSLRNLSADVEMLPADVTSENDVSNMVMFAVERFGTLDILVNCAAVYGTIGPAVEVDSKEWLDAIRINLFGTFLCMKHVLPVMIKKRKGKIVNLSGGGAVSPFPRFSAYSASKAAVVRLTETIAEEVKEYNIDINAIAPGVANTRLLDRVLQAGDRAGNQFYIRAIKQKEEGGVPLEKLGEFVAFLVSPQTDGLTGRLVSFVWDSWQDIPRHLSEIKSSDVYTLRRIVPKDRGFDW